MNPAKRIPTLAEPPMPPAPVRAGGVGIPVGVSSCLLGEAVRFDGGHRHTPHCTEDFAPWFAFVPVCPENAIGLGTPRESIHLRRHADGSVRLVGTKSGNDHTAPMEAFAAQRARELNGLCGYVVAKRSPSCSIERIRVYSAAGTPEAGNTTAGLYMQRFMAANPLVPVEEDGRLNDPALRENFISRVFVLQRWRQLRADGVTAAALLDFHANHKYLLMAHSVVAYRRLGRLLADLAVADLDTFADAYIAELMPALSRPATRKGHANVLQHIAGYFRERLPAHHRQRLQALIDEYRLGNLPLAAPLTLLQHFLADFPDPYLARQVYLAPYPECLRLRAFQ
jgi:uncharacterized protein YbgA (DUF1722 family)/uncharacterized protein YbbK (DUF523 family)